LKQKEKLGPEPSAALAAAAPPSPSVKLKQKANSGLPQSQLFSVFTYFSHIFYLIFKKLLNYNLLSY